MRFESPKLAVWTLKDPRLGGRRKDEFIVTIMIQFGTVLTF